MTTAQRMRFLERVKGNVRINVIIDVGRKRTAKDANINANDKFLVNEEDKCEIPRRRWQTRPRPVIKRASSQRSFERIGKRSCQRKPIPD